MIMKFRPLGAGRKEVLYPMRNHFALSYEKPILRALSYEKPF